MKFIYFLIFGLFFLMMGSCVGCYDCDVHPITNVCNGSLYEGFPIQIEAKDDIQKDAVKKINDFFGIEIFAVSDHDLLANENGIRFSFVESFDDGFLKDTAAQTLVSCNTIQKKMTRGFIHFSNKDYENPNVSNILAHEYMHALGFLGHEDQGLMCGSYKAYDDSMENLITDSEELVSWLKKNYGIIPSVVY